MSTYVVNTGDGSITDLTNSVIVEFEDYDEFDEDAILTYASDYGVPVGPKVDAVKFDAAMAELDAAYTDLRSETYPYPTQYQRVEDAKLALRKVAGL